MLISSYKTSNPVHPYLHLRLRTSSANPRNNMQQMESKEVRYSEKAACGKGLDEFMKCCPNGTPRNRNIITRNTDPLTIPIDSGLPRGHTLSLQHPHSNVGWITYMDYICLSSLTGCKHDHMASSAYHGRNIRRLQYGQKLKIKICRN